MSLNDINSLSHTKWNYKYYILLYSVCAEIPKKSILQREACGHRKNTPATM